MAARHAESEYSVRYFGSKASTVSDVLRLCLADMHVTTAADAFGGIGTVGSALRAAGVHVSTCDLLLLPHAFQYSRIVCSRPALLVGVRRALGMSSAQHVLDHLRRKRLTNSWIVRDFSRRRQFFTEQNASAIAGVWDQIRRWNIAGLLSESDRQQLIAGLINSADLVANTAGTYYAHLKFWHRKALKRFDLKLLEVPRGQPRGEALIGDAYERLAGRAFDLLYLDPPYNSRDYARYYHLPESMASLKHPQTSVHSLSGVPRAVSETSANFRRTLRLDYIENLVTAVKWKRLVVQYSDGAAIPLDELRRFLRSIGSAKEHRLPALGYTTSNRSRDHLHHLFVIDNGTSTASRCLR